MVAEMRPDPKPVKQGKKRKVYISPVKAGNQVRLEHEIMNLWIQAVLQRDGYRCRVILPDGTRCKGRATQAHHIHRRSYHNTRWDVDNGLGLCSFHHLEDLGNLKENTITAIGLDEYERLRALAHGIIGPIDMEEIREGLWEQVR